MPKAVAKQVETPTPQETIAPEPPPKPVKEAKPEVEPETLSEPAPETLPEPIIENTAPAVAEAATIPNPSPEPPLVNSAPEPAQPEPEPQPLDTGLVINENAYQYVETDFDVRTKIGGSAEGKAKITYNLIDGSHYQLKWLTEGRGLAALIFPDLLQISEGVVIKTGLQPSKYLYKFGSGKVSGAGSESVSGSTFGLVSFTGLAFFNGFGGGSGAIVSCGIGASTCLATALGI